MRGKRDVSPLREDHNGITPADAGKTSSAFSPYFSNQDHPRGCGENRESLNYATRDIGSPPRMRGKLKRARDSIAKQRITPADAGKTQCWDSAATARWDHPRGCGENQSPITAKLYTTGSPPRMRGKLAFARTQASQDGITPADAGKTWGVCAGVWRAWDHPRGCGENG